MAKASLEGCECQADVGSEWLKGQRTNGADRRGGSLSHHALRTRPRRRERARERKNPQRRGRGWMPPLSRMTSVPTVDTNRLESFGFWVLFGEAIQLHEW